MTVTVMSLFSYALMAVIALVTAGLIAALVAGLAAIERRRTAAEASAIGAVVAAPAAAGAGAVDPAIVAVIGAAIQAMDGDHRIVWIGEAQNSGGWTSEVRQRHHGSHRPHHDH